MSPEVVHRILPDEENPGEIGLWWSRYFERVARVGVPETGRLILSRDCSFIQRNGILEVTPETESQWFPGRVRRGVVMGAIQSGKTASMIGVAAQALDRGVEIVIVLAGTNLALWHQTYERFISQLDATEVSEVAKARQRVMIPTSQFMTPDAGASLSHIYCVSQAVISRAVGQGRPLVAIAMKNVHHLRALSNLLHQRVYPELTGLDRSIQMLVLDDEADDGSILDERVENSRNPETQDLKQLPRAIADLWSRRTDTNSTAISNLFVTYIGYTATPQANFLQSDFNPLAPTDFAISLRTPFDHGDIEPRSTVYREPRGIGDYYIGGEAFYHRLPWEATCVATSHDSQQDLASAIKAFVIAAAIRQWRNEEKLSYSLSRSETFESQGEAKVRLAEPHSMLVHPSMAISDHFEFAAIAISAVTGMTLDASRDRVNGGTRTLPVQETIDDMDRDEESWSKWLDEYRKSAESIREAFDLPGAHALPTNLEWPEIRQIIIDDVLPNVDISIINSDPASDDRPSFEPQLDGNKRWTCARNLITIFVSGNVMSRGLTLEGLTTTVFYRSADEPLADTQMQMQRWFGYRGKYFELCRVFMSFEQLRLFRSFHDVDEALRRDIVSAMNESPLRAPSVEILQGRNYLTTGKLTALRNWPLSPGAKPFVRITNSGRQPDHNLEVIAETFQRGESHDVTVNGLLRGRILGDTFSLGETADLLDGLRYENYRPSRDSRIGERWESITAHLGLLPENDPSGLTPLYRPPGTSGTVDQSNDPAVCPYSVAAYFRLWDACLSRRAVGLFPTDNPNIPWSMVDLRVKTLQQPRFYIGIRYGSGSSVIDDRLDSLPFTAIATRRSVSGGELDAAWGTQNPGHGLGDYRGDSFFDYHVHHNPLVLSATRGTSWRAPGSPGLVLFYIVEQADARYFTAALGLALPLGGPDQFAVLTSSTGD